MATTKERRNHCLPVERWYLLYGSSCESPGKWEQELVQSWQRARQPSCHGEDMSWSDPLEGQRSSYRVPPVVKARSTGTPTKNRLNWLWKQRTRRSDGHLLLCADAACCPI